MLGEDGVEVTPSGARFLTEFGIDLAAKAASHRLFRRPCLDWSERRYHIAGFVGTEMLRRCFDLGWLARQKGTRALRITPAGRRGLRRTLGVVLAP